MTIRWFLSGKVRHATEMCKHVRKLLSSQEDILAPAAIAEINAAIEAAQNSIASNADNATLDQKLQELEKVANTKLKPYPSAEWRENIEVFLVAIAVAMAIRTFFLQPFKIPTSSMQPTLYGVMAENLRDHPEVKIPGFFQRCVDAVVHGTFYHEVIAPEDCELVNVFYKPTLRFIERHEFALRLASGAEKKVTHWFSTDHRLATMDNWADLHPGQTFRKGEPIVKLKEVTGDHLFVDRVTYNFHPPNRGDIIVFKTKGITRIPDQNQFYIKRLIALGGEKVQIGDDRHVHINGQSLDATTPRFENLYTFSADKPPQSSIYSGHGFMAPFFPNASAEFDVRLKHYLAMGDNTTVSSDSRYWGDLPQENVIGKAFFVYWPISNHGKSRFGMGYR